MLLKRDENEASVTLRPAGIEDEAFLYELYCSTRSEEVAAWGLDPAQQEMFLKLQFAARQRHCDIAFDGSDHKIILCDNHPIGRLLVYRSEREIRLVDIAVLPEQRGRGFGTLLIRGLLDEARSDRPVTLHVDKFSRAARLYQRLGFLVIGDTGADHKMEWRPGKNSTDGDSTMPEIFSIEMFIGHESSKFQMHYGDSQSVELELVSATDVGSSSRQKQFSLIFLGPYDAPISQGIYRVDHERLGALDLFLVPIGRDEKGVRYEAIFNRVVE